LVGGKQEHDIKAVEGSNPPPPQQQQQQQQQQQHASMIFNRSG